MMKKAACFELHLVPLHVILLFAILQRGAGYSTSPTTWIACSSSTGSIDYNITLNIGQDIDGPRSFYFGEVKFAESNGTFLTPEPNYVSRLTSYGTYGISLSGVTTADAGEYLYVYFIFPGGNTFTSKATLSVLVAPTSKCSVSVSQSSNTVTCTVNTGKENCGAPHLDAYWVNHTALSNQFECTVGGAYQCCATSAAFTCYSRSPNDFCKLFPCTPVTTTSLSTTNKKNMTKRKSSSSAVSRKDVQLQMEDKGVKNNDERPPAIHTGTPNKVESQIASMQTDTSVLHRRLPPLGVELKNKPNHHPQPPPPENNDVKDRNLRRLSTNYDDARGLTTEMSWSTKLPPPQARKHPTVEEEAALKEPKKER